MTEAFDTGRPHPARVYDCPLGGNDNFAADRAAAQQGIAVNPNAAAPRQNRAFMQRTVRRPASRRDVRQFLDLGTGLPTRPNVREVAQSVDPAARARSARFFDGHELVEPGVVPILQWRPDQEAPFTDAQVALYGGVARKPRSGPRYPVAADWFGGGGGVDSAVRIRGLVKAFGEFRAVDNLDLTVRRGTCHGVVGPNGAGKSTTLGMAVGLITPDEGTIALLGHDLATDRDRARSMIGVLPEGLDFPERLTGAELLRYTAGLRGLDPAVARRRSAELIEVLGLAKGAGTPLADCSTGTRKKIGLAQALVHAPRLLVLDEPFEAVDPVSALAIRRLLQRFVAGGGTTVLSTHSMLLVEQMCDDVTIVHRGRVVAAGPVTEVAAGGSLEDRFVDLVGAEVAGDGDLDWLTL